MMMALTELRTAQTWQSTCHDLIFTQTPLFVLPSNRVILMEYMDIHGGVLNYEGVKALCQLTPEAYLMNHIFSPVLKCYKKEPQVLKILVQQIPVSYVFSRRWVNLIFAVISMGDIRKDLWQMVL